MSENSKETEMDLARALAHFTELHNYWLRHSGGLHGQDFAEAKEFLKRAVASPDAAAMGRTERK